MYFSIGKRNTGLERAATDDRAEMDAKKQLNFRDDSKL